MTKRRIIRFGSFAFLAVILLAACFFVSKSSVKRYDHTVFIMDTYLTETLYGADTNEAVDCVKRLDSLISSYNESSEIYKLNNREIVSLSADTLDILTVGRDFSAVSNGLFDITVFPVTSLWDINSDNPHVPDDKDIKIALGKTGIDKLTIEGNSVKLSDDTAIDLGGIAKGYACDKVYELYKQNKDIKGAVFSFGSSILLYGKKPNGDFEVAIRNPNSPESSIGTLKLGECFISTSGGYERYFEIDGKKYSHIFNPKTGYPAETDLLSVTVISKSGTQSDCLSTAVYVGGTAALNIIPNDCDFIAVSDDGKIYASKNLSGSFNLTDNKYTVIYE